MNFSRLWWDELKGLQIELIPYEEIFNMPNVIKPTVGRNVWFWRLGEPDESNPDLQPEAAIVAYVWSDRMVNLTVFDRNGIPRGETSVEFKQPEDYHAITRTVPTARYATWMPYQVGQAAKTEEAERALHSQR